MPAPILFKSGIGPPGALLDREPALDNTPGRPKLYIGINGSPTVFGDPVVDTWLYNQIENVLNYNGQTADYTSNTQLLDAVAVFTPKGNLMLRLDEPPFISDANPIYGGAVMGWYCTFNNYMSFMYYDGADYRRLSDTVPPMQIIAVGSGWRFQKDVIGAIDSVVALKDIMVVSDKGNIALGTPEPVDASLSGPTGGWLFSWGITTSNHYSNCYWSGTARYQFDGYATSNYCDPVTGNIYWWIYPLGIAGDPVGATTGFMTLDPAGNLSINGRMNSINTPLDLLEQLQAINAQISTLEARIK